MIQCRAVDEKVSVTVAESPSMEVGVASSSHVHEARIGVEMRGANKWIFTPKPVYGIDKLSLTGDFNEDVENEDDC